MWDNVLIGVQPSLRVIPSLYPSSRLSNSLIKQFPTVKRVKITLGYECCITGTEVNWLGYIIKIPKNYNKINKSIAITPSKVINLMYI